MHVPMNNNDKQQVAINRLQQTSHAIALQIQHVFQGAYKVEARLIGVTNFPPLERTVADIIASRTTFFGSWQGDELVAVIEVSYNEPQLDIDSLVVHPDHFRKGLARRLLRFVLNHYHWETAEVETAQANSPAITLYEQFGFVETRRFQTPIGITKVNLRL